MFGENVAKYKGVAPQAAVAGAINGAAIDRQMFDEGVLILITGAATGTPTTTTVAAKVQHSDDGSAGWADAVDQYGSPVISGVGADGHAKANFFCLGMKRYLRVVVTPAFTGGSAPTVLVCGELLLGAQKYNPNPNI